MSGRFSPSRLLRAALAWLLRQHAEEALRESEQRYERAILASNAGLWEWDARKDEYYVSPRHLELLGFPPGTRFSGREDFLRRVPFHAEDKERWRQAQKELFASGGSYLVMDLRVIGNGETRWVRVNALCFRDGVGRVARWTGSVTDVTEAKRAEEALRRSEERYSLAMGASEEGHFDLDLDSGEIFISERLNQIYGFPPGTRFANRGEYLARVRLHADDADKYHAALAAAVAKDGPERYEFEFRILQPSGEVRWLRTRGKVTRDAEGRARRRTGVIADVTARKLAELGLGTSEGRYALAMEAAGDGHTDWNLQTGEHYISPRLLQICGYAPGATFRDRAEWVRRFPFHPEDRPKWEQAVAAHFAGRESHFKMELRIVVRGEVRWTAFHFLCTRDAAGTPIRWTGSIGDITEQKRADEALRESEQRYERAMLAAEAGFWDWDAATDKYYVSDKLLEMTQIPAGTKLANRADFMARVPFHPEDRANYEKAVKDLFASGGTRLRMEMRLILGGETRWNYLSGLCMRDAAGRVVRWTGSASDITDRKRAEMALRQSEERYALAVAGSDDGVWDVDFAARRVFLSARARELTGLPPGPEMVPLDEFQAMLPLHPDDVPRRNAAMQAHLEGQAPAYEGEFRLRQLDGVYRWRRIHGICVRDANGQPQRMAGSFSDVDARRRAEDALRASEERYSLAMEASEEGHFDVNLDTDEHFTSERLNEIHGFPPGMRTAKRSDFIKHLRFYGDDAEKYSTALAAAEAKDGPERYECEFRIVRPSGEVRWLWTRGQVTRDAEGRARRRIGVVADVTARRQALETLRESESRFRALTELSSDAYWVQDENLRFIPTGSRHDLAGFPADAHMGKTRWELSNATPLSGTWAEHEAVLQTRKPFRDFEYRRVGSDGTVRYLSISGTPIFDEQGAFRGYQGVGRDITDRKRAEEELRESEARFRALTELSSDWYWEQDENLRFTYLSNQAAQLTGYSGESSLGKTRWEIANMEPLSCSWEEHQQVLAARQPFRDLECRRTGPDGTVRYLSMSGAPVFDEGRRFKGYQGIGRNITERKRAEEKLRESEALKSAMFETALDCIISMDHHGRVIEFNPAAERTFGYRRAEAMGKELAELIIPPRLREQHRRGLARYLATGEGPVLGKRVEIAAVRADGAELPVELSVTRIPGEGAPLFTAYLRDITERKRAEEKLRESEARFRSLTEISSDWYWRQDENLRFTYLSAGVSERAGWPADDYLGRLRWEVPDIHPISCSWEEHKEVLAKRQPFRDLEYWRHGKEGLVIYSSISGAPIFDEQGRFKGYQGVGRNITERKRIEEELRSRQEMLELAQKSARAIAFEWRIGADGPDRNRWSPELAAMHGVAPESHDGSFEQWKKLIHPEDWPAVNEAIKHATRTGDVSTEYRVVHPDGSVHWLQAKGRMFFDAAGKPARMVGFMHNVTERKLADDALRLSEERYARAMDGSDAGHWDWNMADSEVFLSERAHQLLALPPDVPSKGRAEILQQIPLHPDDRDPTGEAVKAALESGIYDREVRVIPRPGEMRWLRSRAKVYKDARGVAVRMTGSLVDITERKLAAEALHQSEERYALAVAGSNEGIFDWDLVIDRMYMSQRAQELFGLPLGELWRPRPEWRSLVTVYPDDARQLRQVLSAHIAGEAPYDAEFRVCMPDGSIRWFRQRGIALRDASGKAYRMVGSIGDVTEKHKTEEELRRLERQLRQAQRLEAMGTLAGGIAHDFNNILGAILGYGEMALRDAPRSSRLRRDLDSIVVAGERGRALVDRVLAFSRSGVADRVPVHVEKLAREALDLVSAKLPPNVTVHAKLHAGSAAVLGDPTQVHQVLMNLATNAIQAMPAGGTLRIHLDALRIDTPRVAAIGALSAADYLVLKVADTGTGIAPEIMERIFDPFFTTKEVGTGTGLGLSLVHGIVSDLGGAIDVASTMGAGSTFTVYLPRSGDAVDQSEDEEPEMPRGDGQRVLVVDDEEPLVRLATRTLQELGYAPVGFTSSTAALAAFRADPKRFDAVITDERMPGLSGSALIREVRGLHGSIPIVLMSGYVGAAVARQAREAGAEEVLKKPLSVRDLAASLARVLHS